MVPETDSHHVVDFTLHEIRAFPEICQRIHDAIRLRHPGLEPDTLTFPDRVKLVHDFKSFFVVGPIDRTHMHYVVEVHGRVVVKELCDLMESVPQNGHRKIATPFDGFDEAGRKFSWSRLASCCNDIDRTYTLSPGLT